MPGNSWLRHKAINGVERLGSYAYTSGGSVDSDPVVLTSGGGKGLTFFVQPEDVCTSVFYAKDSQGAWKVVYTETGIAAAERRAVNIPIPSAEWYVATTNTDASAGNVVIDVRENE